MISGQIIIRLYDRDAGHDQTHLESHDFIGECQFVLTDLMCAAGQKYSAALQSGRKKYDQSIICCPIKRHPDDVTSKMQG